MASIFIPTSVLIFGFASKESIHWIVPVIGASLYLPGIYLCFQSILTYVTSSYPAYAASVLAGNDLFRSSIASVFPLFGRAFFVNLGLGPASALLAGISFLMMPAFLVCITSQHIQVVDADFNIVGAVEMGPHTTRKVQVRSRAIENFSHFGQSSQLMRYRKRLAEESASKHTIPRYLAPIREYPVGGRF